MVRPAFWGAFLVGLMSLVSPAWAHDARPGAVAMREESAGEFRLRWTDALDVGGILVPVEPAFEGDCEQSGGTVRCPPGSPIQVLVPGVESAGVKVVVSVRWLSGEWGTCVLLEGETRCEVGMERAFPMSPTTMVYEGVHHFLVGTDHLLFLVALLLVTGTLGRTVAAVTTFTLTHSATLVLSAVGWLSAPILVVESGIALSVAMLAWEALRTRKAGTNAQSTLAMRYPALVSGCFGALHGLGFGSVYSELGMDIAQAARFVLWFNAGLELAQVAVVLLLWWSLRLIERAFRDDVRRVLLEQAVAWCVGATAIVWSAERSAAVLLSML